MIPLYERTNKPDEITKTRQISLEAAVTKHQLTPIALGYFGGILDFPHMGFIARKGMAFFKPQLEAAGFTKPAPDVYDLRDWDHCRAWTRDLITKIQH